MEIHERIKQRREELGLSLTEVAKTLSVAVSTVSRYETKGIENMGIDKIQNLARVLKCSPAYLMGWEEKKALSAWERAKQILERYNYKVIDTDEDHVKVIGSKKYYDDFGNIESVYTISEVFSKKDLTMIILNRNKVLKQMFDSNFRDMIFEELNELKAGNVYILKHLASIDE